MALKIEYHFPTGEKGEYWKISNISINTKDMSVSCTIRLYKTKVDADNGKIPMWNKTFIFDKVDMDYAKMSKESDPRPCLYELLKEDEFFTGCTNI